MPESASDTTAENQAALRERAGSAAALLGLAIDENDSGEGEEEGLIYEKGDQIGRYKLISRLGEGGFGIVWLAEQHEPLRRDVALKIIRPGMDSRAVVARFRAEQKALERMEHPNIAAVLDAGTTEEGRPYFVMELVRGDAITKYADRNHLSLRARLELFMDVCRAVQHAHQKGIMHRDLKPSNILVITQDGKPVPKVIDFGIAKALTDEFDGLNSLVYTAQGLVLGTPQYMAPEQAVLGGGDMDTRVDVYALGAILYELLTGSPPMVLNSASRTSVDKLLRRIHDEDAEPPSTRVRQRLACKQPVPVQSSRLKGDLDWITLRALEKDPERRYATASMLLEELQRHLNDEPVQTGRPSTWYRLQKLVRKHRAFFISAGAIAVIMVVAVVITVRAYFREIDAHQEADRLRLKAEASQQVAQNESQKALGVAGFLTRMLGQAAELVSQGKNPEAMRLALDESVAELDTWQGQTALQAEMFDNLADLYASMGDQKRALALRYRELECMKNMYGPTDPRTLKMQLSIVYGEADQGDKPKAVALAADLIKQWEAAGKRGGGEWFDAVCEHAIQLGRMEGNSHAQEALDEMLGLKGYCNGRGVPAEKDAAYLRRLAELQSYANDFDGARATLEHSLALTPKSSLKRLPSRQATLFSLARVEAREGMHAEAARHFSEAITLMIQASGNEYHPLIEAWIDLARQYMACGQSEDAFRATDAAVRVARANGTDEKLPHALRASAEVRQQAGRLEEALPFRQECAEAQHKLKPEANLWIDDQVELARLLAGMGRLDEAERMAPVIWKETLELPAAYTDDSFMRIVCENLADICTRWQAASNSHVHDADIAMWKERLKSLPPRRGRSQGPLQP